MCFSAPASFIASSGLVALGGASFAVAKKEDKILAAIPFLFGIQQFFEGIQWLYLNNNSSSLIAGYGFLFFAFIVWPIYVPTFVFILDKKRQKILKWFIFLGIAAALYFTALLLTQPLMIYKLNSCINYNFNIPLLNLGRVAYMLIIFGPLFTSSLKILKWLGVITFILALISWFFFTVDFISVWCFFSAIVSSLFFLYIKSDSNKRN